MRQSLKSDNMFKEFVSYLRKMDIGELKINLTNQQGIERKVKEGSELSKM